ncbi:MAG TPA: Ku protein [Streptosporangiaceae bacterium]|nr:Ku protein [Streptosporangiaceae bacterium]
MARAIWTGSLSFGLVNVPVGLYSATEDKTVHFNQFEAGTSDRIRYKRVNERTGQEVEYRKIVKGYEVGDGNFVMITDEELEAVEPGRSRTIEITDFVDLDEIDPIYFQRTYYLAPLGEGTDHAYTLLRAAMAATNKAGVAMFVMRGKQYLVTVRADKDALVLETMFFADEIRDPRSAMENLPTARAAGGRELTIAKQLIDSMATPWQPDSYRDTYREQVEDLIERKRGGEEIVAEGAPPEETNVVDLMEALRRSVDNARGRRPEGSGSSDPKARDEADAREAVDAGDAATGSEQPAQGTSPAAKPAAGDDDLSQLTKRELTELAGRLDIPGRSKMARDDLEAAIRKARRPQRGKKAS